MHIYTSRKLTRISPPFSFNRLWHLIKKHISTKDLEARMTITDDYN